MFADHTIQSIIALACIDRGVTDGEKERLKSVLLGCDGRRDCAVVKYRDAAAMLRLSVPTVKRLAADGKLRRVFGQGTSRAMGLARESVLKFAS